MHLKAVEVDRKTLRKYLELSGGAVIYNLLCTVILAPAGNYGTHSYNNKLEIM